MRIGERVRSTGEHRLRVIAALLAASTTLLSGWPAVAEERSDAAYEAQLVVKGQELIEQHCAKCHAIGRKDTSTHQDAPPFREVVKRYPAEHLAEALAEGIQTGHPDMPMFIFEAHQIGALIVYLNTLAPVTKKTAD